MKKWRFMMKNKPLVVIEDNEVRFQDDVDVVILDRNSLYLYENKICSIVSINDDGSVDVKSVDSTDGSLINKIARNVPALSLEFYSDDEDDMVDFFEIDDV